MSSYQQLAWVYHGINQIQLVELDENKEHISGLISALTAVNLAEATGCKFSAAQLIDIYVGLALRIKASCPNFLQFLHRYTSCFFSISLI